jgi:hypothetical protein
MAHLLATNLIEHLWSCHGQVRKPGLYRWPVQMQLIDPPQIAELLPPPEQYEAPIDHNWCEERDMDMDDIMDITGRTFNPALYALPLEHASEMEGMEIVSVALCMVVTDRRQELS